MTPTRTRRDVRESPAAVRMESVGHDVDVDPRAAGVGGGDAADPAINRSFTTRVLIGVPRFGSKPPPSASHEAPENLLHWILSDRSSPDSTFFTRHVRQSEPASESA